MVKSLLKMLGPKPTLRKRTIAAAVMAAMLLSSGILLLAFGGYLSLQSKLGSVDAALICGFALVACGISAALFSVYSRADRKTQAANLDAEIFTDNEDLSALLKQWTTSNDIESLSLAALTGLATGLSPSVRPVLLGLVSNIAEQKSQQQNDPANAAERQEPTTNKSQQ